MAWTRALRVTFLLAGQRLPELHYNCQTSLPTLRVWRYSSGQYFTRSSEDTNGNQIYIGGAGWTDTMAGDTRTSIVSGALCHLGDQQQTIAVVPPIADRGRSYMESTVMNGELTPKSLLRNDSRDHAPVSTKSGVCLQQPVSCNRWFLPGVVPGLSCMQQTAPVNLAQ